MVAKIILQTTTQLNSELVVALVHAKMSIIVNEVFHSDTKIVDI